MRRTVFTLLAAGLASGGVVWALSADAGPSRPPTAFARHGVIRISHARSFRGLGERRPALVAGELVDAAQRVRLGGGDEVIGALTGSFTPVAVQSRDRTLVAYSSWRQLGQIKPDEAGQGLQAGDPIGIPSVRLYDETTGKDRLVSSGAYAPALSATGELAFVKGDANVVRESRDYTGQVVVGSPRGGSFAQWTTDAARYFTYAWAGSSLLVYRAIPDSEATDLYVFSGPHRSRLLAADATVVALSPDASRVLATVGRRMLEVIRVADGAVESSLALDGPGVATVGAPATPHAVMYSGSWFGDRVVANSDAGLVVFSVKDGLRIESVFSTPFPHGIDEPTFIDATDVIGWADLSPVSVGKHAEPAYEHALVTCDLAASTCTTGPAQPARDWTRWVTNPSRG